MDQILLFLIARIVELVKSALSWKVYGDLSVLHFTLAFTLLTLLISFFRFGSEYYINDNLQTYRNEENKKIRESYTTYRDNRSRKESYARRYQKERTGK